MQATSSSIKKSKCLCKFTLFSSENRRLTGPCTDKTFKGEGRTKNGWTSIRRELNNRKLKGKKRTEGTRHIGRIGKDFGEWSIDDIKNKEGLETQRNRDIWGMERGGTRTLRTLWPLLGEHHRLHLNLPGGRRSIDLSHLTCFKKTSHWKKGLQILRRPISFLIYCYWMNVVCRSLSNQVFGSKKWLI